tara:strand:+ start:42 stop:1238 length:1197 start_codon:yes stop_codon:yes gene_type:complete
MAATDKGVWDVQEVRDKQLASEWPVPGSVGDNHTLYAWGQNADGNCAQNNNDGSVAYYSSPAQIPGTTWISNGVKSDGTLWVWGDNRQGQLGQNEGGEPATRYSSPVQIPGTTWKVHYTDIAYPIHGFGVKTDGTLWAWGSNSSGSLGQNNLTKYSSPVQIPGTTWPVTFHNSQDFGGTNTYESVTAIKTDGSLWVWGKNQFGELGQNSPTNAACSSPVQVGTDTTWKTISTTYGEGTTYVSTKTDGSLWIWGVNQRGELGQNQAYPGLNGVSSPTQIGSATTWKNAQLINRSVLATKTDGTLWSWGYNEKGQLGQGNKTTYSSPVQIPGTTWDRVDTLGNKAVVAWRTDGTTWVWGSNARGQLGINQPAVSAAEYESPVQLPGSWGTIRGTLGLKTI